MILPNERTVSGAMPTATERVPKVSVLITTYNRAQLLYGAVMAALAQDYPNMEIVVSDNASTDNTEAIVRSLQESHSNILYHRNGTNVGSHLNHDIILRLATGEWVVFVSDDDYLDCPSFISDSIKTIDSYGKDKVAFLQTGINVLHESTNDIKYIAPDIDGDTEYINGKKYFLNYFKKPFFSFTTTILKRDLALRFPIFNEKHYGTDVELALLMSLHGDVILQKKANGVYRVHDRQLFSKARILKQLKIFRTYEHAYYYAHSMGIDRTDLKIWLEKAVDLFRREMIVIAYESCRRKYRKGPLRIWDEYYYLFRRRIIDILLGILMSFIGILVRTRNLANTIGFVKIKAYWN